MELNRVKVSIVLDKRRKSNNGKFPVKLRLYRHRPKLQKLYSTSFHLTEQEFESVWLTVKPREVYKSLRQSFLEIENRASSIIKSLKYFNLEEYERQFLGEKEQLINVNSYFLKKLEYHKNREAISTASGYSLTLKSLLKFSKKKELSFEDITVKFLEEYERHCIKKELKSITTVGIYLRNLRAIFNDAKITGDKYPFGRGKYIIKSPKKVKKALDNTTLKILFEGKASNDEQAKAKAFWFFSYLCNGMNVKDILNLRVKDFHDDKITFLRAKTSTNSNQPEPITVYLSEYSKEVIKTYGNKSSNINDYLFNILSNNQSAQEQHRIKQNFTRSINQHFLNYARTLGVKEKISTYYARHSFSTHLIRKGISIEAVGEALGHSNIKTTMHYFAGFEDDSKKEVAKILLDFE